MRQDLPVRRRHMGMRADHQRGAAVDEMAHGHFLAGRLGMYVDDERVASHAQRTGADLPLYGRERIVERIHEHAAHAH